MSSPKILKEILNDIKVTRDELYKGNMLLDTTTESVLQQGKQDYSITWSSKNDTCNIVYDRDISADMLVNNLLKNRQYSFLLYDKSIVQVEYLIKDGKIHKQRLVFIKKHNRIWNKEEIASNENLEDIYLGDWFNDTLGIPTIVRIDYAPDDHVDGKHAISHLTLSNHESCRIPIKGLVSCTEFLRLVLFHFFDSDFKAPKVNYDLITITGIEEAMIHVSWK